VIHSKLTEYTLSFPIQAVLCTITFMPAVQVHALGVSWQ
jgi:hypothetical protein